jgi:hypothetical protein
VEVSAESASIFPSESRVRRNAVRRLARDTAAVGRCATVAVVPLGDARQQRSLYRAVSGRAFPRDVRFVSSSDTLSLSLPGPRSICVRCVS